MNSISKSSHSQEARRCTIRDPNLPQCRLDALSRLHIQRNGLPSRYCDSGCSDFQLLFEEGRGVCSGLDSSDCIRPGGDFAPVLSSTVLEPNDGLERRGDAGDRAFDRASSRGCNIAGKTEGGEKGSVEIAGRSSACMCHM
jgi:hypothetical protein